jgi:hypothetical protein
MKFKSTLILMVPQVYANNAYGNWDDTLTEDLDLSYRVQFKN